MAPRLALIVAALGAIPLFFALLPLLAPILGAVFEFTSAMLSGNSGNLDVNATLPWFAVSFALGAIVVIVLASRRAFGDIKGGR